MAIVHVTKRAALDINEIDRYSLSKWGQQVADEYMQSIDLALQTLSANPNLLRQNNDVSKNFSLYRVREHYLVFSTVEQSLILLTVKGGSLNLPVKLLELEPTLLEEAEFLNKQLSNKYP